VLDVVVEKPLAMGINQLSTMDGTTEGWREQPSELPLVVDF